MQGQESLSYDTSENCSHWRGSFVFGPSVLSQIILEHRLNGIELGLVDVDTELVELMAGVGRQMALRFGVQVQISTNATPAMALDGADFVICSVACQGLKRFAMDYQKIQQYLPEHQITEFGGIAGISNCLLKRHFMAPLVSVSAG